MKRSCVLGVLLALCLGTVSALDNLEITLDVVTLPYYQKINTGEFDEQESKPNRVYDYAADNAMSFFNLKRELFDNSDLRVKFHYDAENYGGLLRFFVDGKTTGNTSALSVNDLIDIYFVWLKAPLLNGNAFVKLWTGNDAYRGAVNRYLDDFDDFLPGKTDNYGPFTVVFDKNKLSIAASDITNMQKDASGASASAIILDAGYKPVTVTFANSGLFDSLWSKGITNSGDKPYETRSSNFGIRIEAEKLFDMLTVAGLYKYANSDVNYENEDWEKTYGGLGLTHHQFGLFADLTPFSWLGLTAGYSGYMKIHEERGDGASWQYPFYHGIDLRARYTGVEKLSLSTHHNISLAAINGDDDPLSVIEGFHSLDVQDFTHESALVIYSSLAAAYQVLPNLSAHLQAANRHARIHSNYDGATRFIDTYNALGLYCGVKWELYPNVSLRGGFDMKLEQYTAASSVREAEAGIMSFGIPLGIMVVF